MEEKVYCYYCGTAYLPEDGKCPLCGSTKQASMEDRPKPVHRERRTEVQRKAVEEKPAQPVRRKKAQHRENKKVLATALVFLSLAVVLLLWFIGDMIGWWPGLEDLIDREPQTTVSENTDCTQLLSDRLSIDFQNVGETAELCISVNRSCAETLYCVSNRPDVVSVSQDAKTSEGTELKSVTFTVTAVAPGATEISIACGKQSLSCPVTVAGAPQVSEEEGTTTTEPPTEIEYVPELNRMVVELDAKDATVTMKVTNLPEGAEVLWRSDNEGIASVNEEGVVTAVAPGKTTVTAEVNGKTVSAEVNCTFEEELDNDGAHLETTDATIKVGERFPLYLYNSDSKHIDDIQYLVDDTSICVVDGNYVEGVGKGTTTVTVVYNGEKYVCIVRVK